MAVRLAVEDHPGHRAEGVPGGAVLVQILQFQYYIGGNGPGVGKPLFLRLHPGGSHGVGHRQAVVGVGHRVAAVVVLSGLQPLFGAVPLGPARRQLHGPVLAHHQLALIGDQLGGQIGDGGGGAVLTLLAVELHHIDRSVAVGQIGPGLAPVQAALEHQGGAPLVAGAAGLGPGVVAVVGVPDPDLLHRQIGGGELVVVADFTVAPGAGALAAVPGGEQAAGLIVEAAVAVLHHPQILGVEGEAVLQHLNGGLHHPVLQLHRAASGVLDIGGQVAEILGAVPGARINGAGEGLLKGIGAEQGGKVILGQIGLEIVRRVRPAVLSGARRPDLEPEMHRQGDTGAQVVLGDGAAVPVHPDLAEAGRGLEGVGQVDHGHVAVGIGGLLEHGAAGRSRGILIGLGLRHPILPGHAVGGIAVQTGDGVGPGIILFAPLDGVGAQGDRLPFDLVVLAGLGGGHPLQGEGQIPGPEVEQVSVIVPLLVAGEVHLLLGHRGPVQEGGVHPRVVVGLQAVHLGVLGGGLQGRGGLIPGAGPGVIAPQIGLDLLDGVHIFRAVGGVEGQVLKQDFLLHRHRPGARRRHRGLDLSGAPDLGGHGLGLGGGAVVLGVGPGEPEGDGRILLQIAGHRQHLFGGQLAGGAVEDIDDGAARHLGLEQILTGGAGGGVVQRDFLAEGVLVQSALAVKPGQGLGVGIRPLHRQGAPLIAEDILSQILQPEGVGPVAPELLPLVGADLQPGHALFQGAGGIPGHAAIQGELDAGQIVMGIAGGQILPHLAALKDDGVLNQVDKGAFLPEGIALLSHQVGDLAHVVAAGARVVDGAEEVGAGVVLAGAVLGRQIVELGVVHRGALHRVVGDLIAQAVVFLQSVHLGHPEGLLVRVRGDVVIHPLVPGDHQLHPGGHLVVFVQIVDLPINVQIDVGPVAGLVDIGVLP